MKKQAKTRAVVKRRRGDALESALLEAGWKELLAVGYSKLTMDGVALRARTSKPVVYRRWPNRVSLVLAVLRHRSPISPGKIPNTGSLREDVLSVMRGVAMTVSELNAESIWALIVDCYIDRSDPAVGAAGMEASINLMTLIIRRSIDRGSLHPCVLPRRVVTLPLDLARHEMLITRAAVPEEALVRIVDHIFLPLLEASSNSDCGREDKTDREMIAFAKSSKTMKDLPHINGSLTKKARKVRGKKHDSKNQ